ncbi:adenylyltransferase/cytidyltransferase family protein [Patescibacteria group bacterium]|nr:adenylyltransferase/cytidyltransferase family protein [Patescibacteria group bacterium]MBU1890615.1 adenylyltransferase/cytidyltransferase family protein [Patescibacteria group bacterium]
MKTVMVFGTFDRVHPGHEFLFSQAKKHGDWLVVLVSRDQTVLKVKGRLPKQNEKKRQQGIEQLESVDQVVLGSKSSPYTIFDSIQPDVVCLGYDQKTFVEGLADALKRKDIKAEIIRLGAYKPEKYKSSLLN